MEITLLLSTVTTTASAAAAAAAVSVPSLLTFFIPFHTTCTRVACLFLTGYIHIYDDVCCVFVLCMYVVVRSPVERR